MVLFAAFIREADGPLRPRRGRIDLEEEIAAGPPADLVPPDGVLLLALADGEPAGLGGIRHLDTDVAEVKTMYLAPAFRGPAWRGGFSPSSRRSPSDTAAAPSASTPPTT